MKPNSEYILGIDLGGTQLKLQALTPEGKVIERASADSGGDDWTDQVAESTASLERTLGPPAAVGVAAPGLASEDGARIAYMPGRLPGLEGLNWTSLLNRSDNVPVLNDAHAALLGETWRGAAQGARNAILLTLGTGVGGAAIIDGRLLKGHIGRAGHFGHISLDPNGELDIVNTPGSLEDAVGNHTLSQRSEGVYTDTEALGRDVASGAEIACNLWNRMIRDLAAGIASLINVLDPAVVLIGGGIAQAGDLLFQPLRQQLDTFEWRPGGSQVQLLPAELGGWAGAYGAAFQALQQHDSSKTT